MGQESGKQWALVTGASSGIGEVFARRFAKEGWNVVLVARSVDKLNEIADALSREHSVKTYVIQANLSRTTACWDVFERTRAAGIEVECLVNNAGFGAVGKFHELAIDRQLEMIDVNVKALVALTHLFLSGMIKKRRGTIVNVSSTASFQPIPYFSTYAATKAFVTFFSESLWGECERFGVRVLNLCPGRTHTNFRCAAGLEESPKDPRPSQTAEEVADICFRAMKGNRPTVVCGFLNQLTRRIERLLPTKILIRLIRNGAEKLGYAK